MSGCYEACWCPKCGGALRRNTIARHVRYHRCVNGAINRETDESDEDNGEIQCDDDLNLNYDNDPELNCDHIDQGPNCDDDDTDPNPGANQNSNDGSNEDDAEINGDDSPDPNDRIDHAERRLTDDDINRLVLQTLKNKVKFGSSRDETLSQLQSVFELTHDDRMGMCYKKTKGLGL